ncbi:hypothetical protein GGI07_002928 [Coemansia sp. Benny D115]|nr:hypothetical protein GGI07_002928 [Coemansia sp. Benny D115]
MPVYSPFPDVTIPPCDISTFYFGLAHKRRRPDNDTLPLVHDSTTGKTLNLSDIQRQSEHVASGLSARGFIQSYDASREIDAVAVVYATTSIELISVHHGVLMAGGTYAPMDPGQSTKALAEHLDSLRPSAAFVTLALLPRFLEACEMVDLHIPTSLVFIVDSDPTTVSGYGSLASLVEEQAVYSRLPMMSLGQLEHRVALVVCSSGTTGGAKGVKLTHRNIIAAQIIVGGYMAQEIQRKGLEIPRETVLSSLPSWHIYGLSVLFYQSLASGSCIVQMPEFKPLEYLEAIQQHCVERLCATPAVLQALVNCSYRDPQDPGYVVHGASGRRFKIDSVKAIVCGGAMIPATRLREYSEYFGQAPIHLGYGSTETSSIAAGCTWGTPAPGATGILYPNTTALVLDADGQETQGFGELCIKGIQVMAGYADKSLPSPFVHDGFVRMGDYARVSEDGNVYVRGRMADLVHLAGDDGPRVVAPTDVECLASEHPAVRDCAAKGDGKGGLLVVVVLAGNSKEELEDVETWVQERNDFGLEMTFKSAPAIKKTPGGKVIRWLLD